MQSLAVVKANNVVNHTAFCLADSFMALSVWLRLTDRHEHLH